MHILQEFFSHLTEGGGMYFPAGMCNCTYPCMFNENSEWSVCVARHDFCKLLLPTLLFMNFSLWWYLKYQQQWTKTHIQDRLKLTCTFQCRISAENNCTWARMCLEDMWNVYELMKDTFGFVLYERWTKLLCFHCDHIRLRREWKNWHNVNACWKDCALTKPTKKFFQ
jgi:hypothetical protein